MMLEIASIKGFLDALKQVVDIATGARRATEDQFEKTLGSLFTELDSVAQSYFAVFEGLFTAIRESDNQKALDEALDIAFTQRAKMVMTRNRVAGAMKAYENVLEKKGFSTRPLFGSGPRHHLLIFLWSVDSFFYEPQAMGTSKLTVLSDSLRILQSQARTDFATAKEESITLVQSSMGDLERFWKESCLHFETLKLNKAQVMQALR